MNSAVISFFLWTYFKIQPTDSKDTILRAICEKAYADATVEGAFNTMLTTDSLKVKASESKEAALKKLVTSLSSFADNTEDYDSWHNNFCKDIKDSYKGEINDDIKDRFSYGNAQKLVNMAMKYLYLLSEIEMFFEDADAKKLFEAVKDHSEELHIPIDSFIIDAIWRDTQVDLPLQDNTSAQRKKEYKTPSDYVQGWSTWKEETYISVQKALLDYIKAQGKHPLEWESEMWIKEAKNRHR